MHRGFWE